MLRRLMLVMGVLALGAGPVLAQASGSERPEVGSSDRVPDVVLRVDGLACPFCAAGLEKKLEALDDIAAVDVKLDDGEVYLFLKADRSVSGAALEEAVKHAGFALRTIQRREQVAGG